MECVRKISVVPHHFKDDGVIPNNPFPLIVYPGVLRLPVDDPARTFEILFMENQWGHSWRNGIYAFHHYHSMAHEVLGIAAGHADVLMGGPKGVRITVRAGDVMAIPAGVGHKNLGSSPDLLVIGAYPIGQRVDLCRESPRDHKQAQVYIPRIPLPTADPVYGADGPLMQLWKK